jgi:hypothetical protein
LRAVQLLDPEGGARLIDFAEEDRAEAKARAAWRGKRHAQSARPRGPRAVGAVVARTVSLGRSVDWASRTVNVSGGPAR